MTTIPNPTPADLARLMDFDHVVRVLPDGTLTDDRAEVGDRWAPEVNDDACEGPWALLAGYTGQDRYHGPTMHPSERIGGALADDILARPGWYVACVSYAWQDPEPLEDPDLDDAVAGWAVARIVDPVTIEARCETCGETFLPDGPRDLTHAECDFGGGAGAGTIVGWYR